MNSSSQDEHSIKNYGRRVLSVTQALDLSGIRKIEPNEQFAIRAPIGTAVHELTAWLDQTGETLKQGRESDATDKWESVSPEVAPYAIAWQQFKIDQDFVPRMIEQRFIIQHGGCEFGMTLDREGLMHGEPWIIDIKTSKVFEPRWKIQLAGYHVGVKKQFGAPKERPYRWKRGTVQLFSDGKRKVPYKFVAFDDPSDEEIFACSLAVATFHRNNYR
jgi:hypothetical protein